MLNLKWLLWLAGLYESIPLEQLEQQTLETAAEGVFWDADFQQKLLSQLSAVGWAVEKALGGEPQDIEGVWRNGSVTVVQARPQVV